MAEKSPKASKVPSAVSSFVMLIFVPEMEIVESFNLARICVPLDEITSKTPVRWRFFRASKDKNSGVEFCDDVVFSNVFLQNNVIT